MFVRFAKNACTHIWRLFFTYTHNFEILLYFMALLAITALLLSRTSIVLVKDGGRFSKRVAVLPNNKEV